MKTLFNPLKTIPFCHRLLNVYFVVMVIAFVFPSNRAESLTFTVTNTNNSGAASLRQAVLDANTTLGPDTIEFNIATLPNTIILSEEILIQDDLTILGPGAEQLTISGDESSRIFNIVDMDPNSEISVEISGLGLADGKSEAGGGAILNVEDLTIDNCKFTGNKASSSMGGTPTGGGMKTSVGILIVTNSTFYENDADGGGGISTTDGTLIVTNSTFYNNMASIGGGGVFNFNNINLTHPAFSFITNSTFYENSALFGGGGVANSAAMMTVTNSTFYRNVAFLGGAIADEVLIPPPVGVPPPHTRRLCLILSRPYHFATGY